jgi:hypothetical protein
MVIDKFLPSSQSSVALCPDSQSDIKWMKSGPNHHHTWLRKNLALFSQILTDSSGIKEAGFSSRVCSVLTDLQLATATPASAE